MNLQRGVWALSSVELQGFDPSGKLKLRRILESYTYQTVDLSSRGSFTNLDLVAKTKTQTDQNNTYYKVHSIQTSGLVDINGDGLKDFVSSSGYTGNQPAGIGFDNRTNLGGASGSWCVYLAQKLSYSPELNADVFVDTHL